MPKTRESGIHLASPKSHVNNLLTNMFFPLMISKSVNVAENMMLVYSRTVRSRKQENSEQLSLPIGSSWRNHWFPCSCSTSRSTCRCGGEFEAFHFFPLLFIITLSRLWLAMARGCELSAEG